MAAKESEAARLGIDGVSVMRTLPGSPAASADLKGASDDGMVEDVITKANGKPVRSMEELAAAFEDAGVGDKVSLTVSRDGRNRIVTMAIADLSQLNDA